MVPQEALKRLLWHHLTIQIGFPDQVAQMRLSTRFSNEDPGFSVRSCSQKTSLTPCRAAGAVTGAVMAPSSFSFDGRASGPEAVTRAEGSMFISIRDGSLGISTLCWVQDRVGLSAQVMDSASSIEEPCSFSSDFTSCTMFSHH
ncbi:hypothetical protein AKJ16_DCAP23251, partial [Drosera capensis]